MRGDLLLRHLDVAVARRVTDQEAREPSIQPVGMDFLELGHQAEHDRREGLDGQIANRRLGLEQSPELGARDDGHPRRGPGLDPRGVEQVVEDAIQGEHAGLSGVDQVQRGLASSGREREHPQLSGHDDVGARDALASLEHGRRLRVLRVAKPAAQQRPARLRKDPERLEVGDGRRGLRHA
jgi:hypothetical protein